MTQARNDFDVNAQPLPAEGQGRRILCDCNGTLFDQRFERGLNRSLVDFLIAAEARGYEVIVHSGEPNSNIMLNLPIQGRLYPAFKTFMEQRPTLFDPALETPIICKGEPGYESRTAFLTIDDEHGSGYHSQARLQWSPASEAMAQTMGAWSRTGPRTAVAPERSAGMAVAPLQPAKSAGPL